MAGIGMLVITVFFLVAVVIDSAIMIILMNTICK
ncbi:hypothetical protein M2454_002593 [Aequitasia blattaphilus]